MQKNRNSFAANLIEIFGIVVIGVLGRLIPHVPNVTPFTSISLFAGARLARFQAFLITFISFFISDVGLSFISGYPLVGYFSLFTYSGFAIVILIGSKLKDSKKAFPLYVLGATSVFWIWTNFGSWLTSGLYPKTLAGVGACYYLALPFLRNALVGDLIWSSVIFGAFYFLAEKRSKIGVRS
ncbi:MAG: hypothetical protein KKE11_00195 [Gammaproteobacteria bacterium]|nr:hypothetical protein [Gammaproteobacteria bacterium]